MNTLRDDPDRCDGPDSKRAAEAGPGGTVLDPIALDRLRSLDPPGQPDTLRRIVELFLETTPPDVQLLEQAFDRADWPTARRLAHKLKSSAATVGASVLASLFGQVEREASHGLVADAPKLIASLRSEFDATCAALARLDG